MTCLFTAYYPFFTIEIIATGYWVDSPMFAATVTLLAIYLLTALFYTGSICMCLARYLSGSSRAHRLWHWLERLSILGYLVALLLGDAMGRNAPMRFRLSSVPA